MGELKWITITVPVEMTATTKEMGTTFLTGACPRFGAVVAEGQAALVRSEDVAQKILAAWCEPATGYAKRLAEIEVGAASDDDVEPAGPRERTARADRGWLLAQLRERDEQLADMTRDRDEMKAIARRAMFTQEQPLRCRRCGGVAEEDRRCWASPTCHACLPPPPPLDVVDMKGVM